MFAQFSSIHFNPIFDVPTVKTQFPCLMCISFSKQIKKIPLFTWGSQPILLAQVHPAATRLPQPDPYVTRLPQGYGPQMYQPGGLYKYVA